MIAALPDRATPRVDWTSAAGEVFTFAVSAPDPAPPVITTAALPATGSVDAEPLLDRDLARVATTDDESDREEKGKGSSALSAPVSDRALGTLVHRLFQQRAPVEDLTALVIQAGHLSRDDDEGDTGPEVAKRAAEVYQVMRQRPDVTELLSSGEAHYEVPFSLRLAGPDRIVRGQIDGVIVPPDGPIIVIEFKTGRAHPEHEKQVSVYRRALAAAWPGRGVETRIFYFQAGNSAP
jgi:ATP-dependent exoDNAse (exonuclease V) beta subunit